MADNNSFYITFTYNSSQRIQEKDKKLEKYLKKSFKRATIEKFTEKNEKTECGIAMKVKDNLASIQKVINKIGTRIDFIESVKIRYPRTY